MTFQVESPFGTPITNVVIIADSRPWSQIAPNESVIAAGDGRGQGFLSLKQKDYFGIVEGFRSKAEQRERGFRELMFLALQEVFPTPEGRAAFVQGQLAGKADMKFDEHESGAYARELSAKDQDLSGGKYLQRPFAINIIQALGYASEGSSEMA